MNKKLGFSIMLTLFVSIWGLGVKQVNGATLTVGCSGSTYPTIQSAVTAANPGDTIVVCPGTYVEQVTVPAGKNNLTLRSQSPLAAVIKAPAVMLAPKAIVRVNGARSVTIRAFTITGPGGFGCDSLEYGIRVDNGGSAFIRDNHITEIRDNPFGGCQNGVAILVGRFAEGQIGSAVIQNNRIDKYQKGGIVISNLGSRADITDNNVKGVGPTSVIAQNGIQISAGAKANVEDNEVSDNIYTPQTVVSTGILLFEPGQVNLEDNQASRNDVNIYAFNAPNPVITGNRVSDGPFDGIDLTDGTKGAIVSHNTSRNNVMDGIFIDAASTGNTITHNRLRGNGSFDAEDQSVGTGSCGTANTWKQNSCRTDNKGGCLCSHGGNDGDDEDRDDHDGGQGQNAVTTQSRTAVRPLVQTNRVTSPF
ncbi:MAG TPA: right-handed parallel beta-helix repeat-containing protein [Pyrinomonadaceae bacterium]|nr:right-handed parallel beta-helix repeat-containing protein [Pyrinomonadaceae bacterium]